MGDLRYFNESEVHIVNGLVDKFDGNFVHDLSYDVIGDSNILLGPYPMSMADVDTMV